MIMANIFEIHIIAFIDCKIESKNHILIFDEKLYPFMANFLVIMLTLF